MKTYLVLDLGSSSTRAMLYTHDCKLVTTVMGRAPFEFNVSQDGTCEDDPDLALRRVEAVLDQISQEIQQRGYTVTDVGISSYASSLLLLDEHFAPLTPIYTYADTRNSSTAAQLREAYDEIATLQRTGCRIRANYAPARMMWLWRTQPNLQAQTRHIASLSDYICQLLFGEMRAGISVWSWSGLLNVQSRDWDAHWLEILGLNREQLPVIAAEPKPVVLTPIYAKRWSWLNGARLHPALGDGAAANIGAGCVNESRVAVTIGTTAAMRMVIPDYLPPSTMPSPALWCYRVDATNTLWGGATSEGGNVHAWLLRNLALDREKLEHNLSAMPPDSHGLTVLPLFVGERSPGFADHARATLDGVSLGTTPVQIARACLEAVAYRLTLIYRAIELFATTRRQNEIAIFANGGALQASPTWAQIIADSTGRPICMCDEPEPTARGVALWLARTNGLQDLPPPILGTVFEPNAHHHAIYQTAIARQIELYEKLI